MKRTNNMAESPHDESIMKRRSDWNNPYLRAGLFGFPFCCFGAVLTRRPVFLLGLGFFAAFLFPALYEIWRERRNSSRSSQDKTGTGDRPNWPGHL
jgi:hypothetical protein